MSFAPQRPPSPDRTESTDSDQREREAVFRDALAIATQWRVWLGALLVCAAATTLIHIGMDAWDGIGTALAAVAFSAAVAGAPIYWRSRGLDRFSPVVSTLLTIAFRTLLMVGALGIATATKWTHRNSFALSLLGCYFIFLILESVLSIVWYSSRSSR